MIEQAAHEHARTALSLLLLLGCLVGALLDYLPLLRDVVVGDLRDLLLDLSENLHIVNVLSVVLTSTNSF